MENSATKDSLVVFQTSQGSEVRAIVLRLTRHLAVFEMYTPSIILQRSEVLQDFQILLNDRLVYAGRAVITNLVSTATVISAEAALEGGWRDVNLFFLENPEKRLRMDFEAFMQASQQAFHIAPEFKIAVADMQLMLMEVQRWLEQVELGVRSQPTGDRLQFERSAIHALEEPVMPLFKGLFDRFEAVSQQLAGDLQPSYGAYVKRQLHPWVLCAPFMYRAFHKPLGYAGDYEMVNMMVRDPYEGSSIFAKMLNTYFLSTPPVVAHRNRITRLTELLVGETCRMVQRSLPARVFSLGCGPAVEVQNFLSASELSQQAQFTLLDFNDETLMYTDKILAELKRKHQRRTPVELIKKSVAQLLKEAARPLPMLSAARYDVVCCAGLFDYLANHVCERLMNALYELLAPGGLLVATNIDPSNSARTWMEYSVGWHLIHRNHKQLVALYPRRAPLDACRIRAEPSGLNNFIEVRKPEDAN